MIIILNANWQSPRLEIDLEFFLMDMRLLCQVFWDLFSLYKPAVNVNLNINELYYLLYDVCDKSYFVV